MEDLLRIVGKQPAQLSLGGDENLPMSTALKLARFPLQYQPLGGEFLCLRQDFAQR